MKTCKTTDKKLPPPEIVSLGTLDIDFFSRKRLSRYDGWLERLKKAPANSALKVPNLNARYSILKRARALNLKVLFGESEGVLYVKLAEAERESKTAAGLTVLKALQQHSPALAPFIAKTTGLATDHVVRILDQLIEEGLVEKEGGAGAPVYRILPTNTESGRRRTVAA